jgi:hypothetical protein
MVAVFRHKVPVFRHAPHDPEMPEFRTGGWNPDLAFLADSDGKPGPPARTASAFLFAARTVRTPVSTRSSLKNTKYLLVYWQESVK